MFSLFIHLLTTFALLPPLGSYASRCIEYGIHMSLPDPAFSYFWINTKKWKTSMNFMSTKDIVCPHHYWAHSHFLRHKREFLHRSLRFLLCCSLLSLHLKSQSSQQQWSLIFSLTQRNYFLPHHLESALKKKSWCEWEAFLPCASLLISPRLVTVQHMKTICIRFVVVQFYRTD